MRSKWTMSASTHASQQTGWDLVLQSANSTFKVFILLVWKFTTNIGLVHIMFIRYSLQFKILLILVKSLVVLRQNVDALKRGSTLESASRFILSASPVLSRFTSSSTCQPISLIMPALITHHSFTLSLQAQNLPFQQILSTLDFF